MCHFAGQAQKITIYRDVKLISTTHIQYTSPC